MVVGLRTSAGGSVTGIEETSLRAPTKLEQVLPSRLRHRVNTLHVGAETPSALVWMITSVDTDLTLVSGPPALADALRTQATRCLQAIRVT